jgi:hypothetical protein
VNPKILHIAEILRERYLNPPQNQNEISIFLCGGNGSQETRFRRKLGKKISEIISKYKYDVYYPEDMFIELILGPERHDLLTLENLLANSVNVVAILLQSPGTFTELGAFANYKKLKDKLIVVIDQKYEHARSFINYGPIRYLKTKTRSRVLFTPMDEDNLNVLVKKVVDSAREIAKHSFPSRDISNPIFAYKFYLALIYVFEPLPKSAFLKFSELLSGDDRENAKTSAEAVLNSLINERKATIRSDNFFVTQEGIDDLIYSDTSIRRSNLLSKFLSNLRIDALNLILRREYWRIWGEAR